MSGSVTLSQSHSVFISTAPVISKVREDAWGQSHHMWPGRCLRAVPLQRPSWSDWPGLPPRVMESSGFELLLSTMSESAALPQPGSVLRSMIPVTMEVEGYEDAQSLGPLLMPCLEPEWCWSEGPELPPRAMVESRPRLLLMTVSGSMALL